MVAQRLYLHHVIAGANSFECGICSNSYREFESAEICLSTCWEDAKLRVNVSRVKRAGEARYRCDYCIRDYADFNSALKCSKGCVENLAPKLLTVDFSKIPERPKRLYAEQTKIAPVSKFTRNLKVVEDADTIAEPVTAPDKVEPTPVAATETITIAEAAPPADPNIQTEKAKAPRDNTKRFTRDGAKYVCVNCSKKYFTREEVESCFNGHTGS